MKKLKVILFALGFSVLLNSCVYSLFPIYTEDSLVFNQDLIGMWQTSDENNDYVLFEKYSKKLAKADPVESEKKYKYKTRIKEGLSISTNEPLSDEVVEKLKKSNLKGSREQGKKTKDMSAISNVDFSGTVVSHSDESYLMTVKTGDKYDKYLTHLTDIGGDLFLDLYPITAFSSSSFSDNYFPVHTFLKVDISKGILDMTFFNLEKLNELFDSNLIRMRHENVDGVILITAQPNELRKFLDKYSEDESVYEETKIYQKVNS